jgi:hypothetical protein
MSGFKRAIQRNQAKQDAAKEKARIHNANIIAQANALLQQAYQNGFLKGLEVSNVKLPSPGEQPVEPGNGSKDAGSSQTEEQAPIG